MNSNLVYSIRKTSNGLGFMLFTASISMYVIAFLMTFALYREIDNTMLLLIDIIVSITSLFLIGLFYCLFSRTAPGEIINVKWVKLSIAVPLIFIALAVSFAADYLTEMLQSVFSAFGVENGIDLSTESNTLLDNILNVIAVSVVPPLVEEFLFRGILLGKLRKFGDSPALFLSSMLFALMHGNIIQIPFAFIVGLALGFLTVKTGSILPSIVVHFIVNFRSVMISIMYDNKILSEAMLNNIYYILLFAVFVFGIISAAILSRKKNFFKLESRNDIAYRQVIKSSLTSVGMIFFMIHMIFSTLETISVSWLNLDGLFK